MWLTRGHRQPARLVPDASAEKRDRLPKVIDAVRARFTEILL